MASPDLLIVLGKNIGVGSTPEDIRRDPEHLSTESRLGVMAAGVLYDQHYWDMDILFSSGRTAGPDVPSEAGAMRDALLLRHPEIPADQVLVEDKSRDTATNAIEVAKMLKTRPYELISLMSVSYHVANAAKLFRRRGIHINRTFSSDVVLAKVDEDAAGFVRDWSAFDRIKKERRNEFMRKVMLSTVDPKGMLLSQVTARSRG